MMRSYRTKVAEPIELLDRSTREQHLADAGYNVFGLDASSVFIDLLTDSGTGAMSDAQWAAIVRGDEAYAGSRSFEQLEAAIEDVMGFDLVVPAHQGRGAEHLLYGTLLDQGDIALNNTHFDTTRAHIAAIGAEAYDCPAIDWDALTEPGTFKGDMSLDAARTAAAEHGERIGCIIQTITNNSAGGQPVSIENLDAAADLAAELEVPFVIDACRFAENAYFNAEDGADISAIAREQLARADAVVMSGKKDGLVNIGGFVAVRDEALYAELRQRAILYEGYPTYGGMAGRDLAAMAVGLTEAIEHGYLEHRISQVSYLGERLHDIGVPVVRPTGGHAIYVDAGQLFAHLETEVFPGQSLVCALYLEGGVRAVELGSLAFPGTDRPELVRLAVPRRMYHDEHLEHVVETFEAIVESREEVPGYELIDDPGQPELRHFSAALQPIDQ